jgi:pimeloyl-ACP methyl ester carboxylesterase
MATSTANEAAEGFDRSSLTIEGFGSLSVRVWRAGEGSPVLFLHGYERHPGGAPFLRRLAEGHAVFAPEQPGFGRSDGLPLMDSFVDYVLFYRELARSWGVDQIDVVGHSLGGMLAAEIAALCPQLVRRLVLVNPFGLWDDECGGVDPYGAFRAVQAAKWVDASAPPSEPTSFDGDPADKEDLALFEAANQTAATKLLWPLPDRGLRRRLPFVAAPTLVVHGATDGLVPAQYAATFADLIPNAELRLIEGAGHYPMLDQEDEFFQAVEPFLAG